MRPTPRQPSPPPTPPLPERAKLGIPTIPSTWVGTKPGALPITHEYASLSEAPERIKGKRQGSSLSPGNNRAGPIRRGGTSGGINWIYAPASSHISRFALIPLDTDDEGQPAGTVSIQVIFKGPPAHKGGNGVGESSQFVYYFDTIEQGQSVFDALRRSPHPFGSVLKPQVIDTGIPYHLISRS